MKKKAKLIIMVTIIAIIFGIGGFLIGKYQSSNIAVENEDQCEVAIFLEGIEPSNVIAVCYYFCGSQYLLMSQNSIEKLVENIQSYDVKKLENTPSIEEIVTGGSEIVVYTRENCYTIVFTPSEYKCYDGEFYTTNDNEEFHKSIMRIYLEDVKENDLVLHQKHLEEGVYDYYY